MHMSYVGSSIFLRLFILSLFLCGCSTSAVAPVSDQNTDQKSSQQNRKASKTKNDKGVYVVVKGDTLYSIAWNYGNDYRDIARWNRITAPFVIYPGQIVRLESPPVTAATPLKSRPILPDKKEKSSAKQTRKSTENVSKSAKPLRQAKIKWRWPTRGKIVRLNTPISKKGVNITGTAGQAIKAAAAGDIVYSGSGLLGYGKLIIIKHNETFLSAYAHNNDILVKEGESVTVGQKIATMGRGNYSKPILHFEIRIDGKPVNPLKHLPSKQS